MGFRIATFVLLFSFWFALADVGFVFADSSNGSSVSKTDGNNDYVVADSADSNNNNVAAKNETDVDNCLVYTCEEGYEPFPTIPLKLPSRGCEGKLAKYKRTAKCCDRRTVCYQICGITRHKCDRAFKGCLERACEREGEVKEKRKVKCDKAAAKMLEKMLENKNDCDEFNKQQEENCKCMKKDILKQEREEMVRSIYQEYNPKKMYKVDEMFEEYEYEDEYGNVYEMSTYEFAGILRNLAKEATGMVLQPDEWGSEL